VIILSPVIDQDVSVAVLSWRIEMQGLCGLEVETEIRSTRSICGPISRRKELSFGLRTRGESDVKGASTRVFSPRR
jgi:hypothetical protein